MSIRPKDSEKKQGKLPLTVGDWMDPSGAIVSLHHQWYFCKAAERAVPQMVDNLFALREPYRIAMLSPENSSGYEKDFLLPYKAWASRWKVPQDSWLWRAGSYSLTLSLAYESLGRPPMGAALTPYPLDIEILPHRLSEALEQLNPGWKDQTLEFLVPSFTFTWLPTQQTKRDLRKQIHEFLDSYLDDVFADAETLLEQGGSVRAIKGQAGTAKFDHYVWAARNIILGHTFLAISRDYIGDDADAAPGKVSKKVKELATALELPITK